MFSRLLLDVPDFSDVLSLRVPDVSEAERFYSLWSNRVLRVSSGPLPPSAGLQTPDSQVLVPDGLLVCWSDGLVVW